jgi:hypothetical protein
MEILDTPFNSVNLFLRSSSYTQAIDLSKTNLIFDLNEAIFKYSNMDTLVSCESFQFTNSFYTINENNYKFIYKILNANIITVSIPFGFYDIDSLILKLNLLMTGIFTFSYDTLTYKIKIIQNTGLTFILLDDGKNNNCYEILGIDDLGFSSYVTSYISPYLFNLMSVQVLHVCVPNINIKSISLKETSKYNIISSIQIISQFGSVQTYLNPSNFSYKISDDTIPFINVVILDQDFNVINFNNIDWFLSLSFKFAYKKVLDIPKTLEQYHDGLTAVQELQNEEERNYINSILNND